MPTVVRPPYDPELAAALEAEPEPPETITPDMIQEIRRTRPVLTPDEIIAGRDITHREVTVPGYEGSGMTLSIFAPAGQQGAGPGIYHIHGGGMIVGERFTGLDVPVAWVDRFGAVCVSVEYRLAPEFPDPYPTEDCYAGLTWVAEHAAELGLDPDRLIIEGSSAGGGLSAGVALLARDRQGPALAGQVLICPMLDDRDQTVSAGQFAGFGPWDRGSNRTAWAAYLSGRQGTGDVSVYAAPARATDLSGLPPACIDVGSAEVFRDEDVAYASQIWADGGVAELHVWPGAYHSFDAMFPDARLSRMSRPVRTDWVARLLGA
jgi:acetyl esterase/lipase